MDPYLLRLNDATLPPCCLAACRMQPSSSWVVAAVNLGPLSALSSHELPIKRGETDRSSGQQAVAVA